MKITLGILFSALWLTACNYRVDKLAGKDLLTPQRAEDLSYAFVMSSVIQPKCFECHSAETSAAKGGGLSLNTYQALLANLNDIRVAVESGSMPWQRPPLSANEKAAILDWIAAGAPETVAEKTEPQVPQVPTAPQVPQPPDIPQPLPPAVLDFETVYRVVIKESCFNCHKAPANRGGVNLETYAEVIKNLPEIKFDIEMNIMPRNRPFSEEQRDLILKWIEAGAPEKAEPLPPNNAKE